MKYPLPALFALLLLAGPAQADTRFLFSVGYNHGGDSLATIVFVGGYAEAIRAGSGASINAGAVHHFDGTPWSLQATAGYLIEDTSARNSRARFSRYPIEVLGFWRQGHHRFGGGLAWHLSPTLDMDNLGGTVDFDDAVGLVAEYGYGAFSIRYTFIDYSPDGFNGKADGNGLGIYVSSGF